MTFLPDHPTELVAEALNRFGPKMDTPEARKDAERFIRETLASIEEQGLLSPVPWFVHVTMDTDSNIHFIVVPEPLVNRATRHVEKGGKHVLIDTATNVTTETAGLLSGIAEHANNVEQHLNKHKRN
jgi:hypothetical protein